MRRSTFLLVLSLTAVFVSGALVGGFGYRACTAGTEGGSAARRDPPRRVSPAEYRRRFTDMMKTRVGIDDRQVAELNVILDRTEKRMHELDERTRPDRQAIIQMQRDEIRAMLNPTQQTSYDKLLEERAKRRRDRRNNSQDQSPLGEHPPGPPPGH